MDASPKSINISGVKCGIGSRGEEQGEKEEDEDRDEREPRMLLGLISPWTRLATLWPCKGSNTALESWARNSGRDASKCFGKTRQRM